MVSSQMPSLPYTNLPIGQPDQPATPATSPRLLTLDVFRGLTIFLMIVVNTQGGGATPYEQLLHADWNGFTLTDLVFPSFLFAVGNALFFVLNKRMNQPRSAQLVKIARRSLLIFLVGLALSWYSTMSFSAHGISFVGLAHLRILAVLQRIALCYGIAALLALYVPVRGLWIVSVILLLGYWGLLYFGATDPAHPYGETTNLVRTIDLRILGEAHMYRERGLLFDPEGLLSTLPATVNVIAGYLTGLYVSKKGMVPATAWRMLLAGLVLAGLGWIWNNWFPVNKKLWTSSFVLVTVGLDLILMAILFELLDIPGKSNGKGVLLKSVANFFAISGKNPLAVYIFSNLLLIVLIWPVAPGQIWIDWINAVFFQRLAPGPLGCLLFSIVFALFCWMLAWGMDRRKMYLRL